MDEEDLELDEDIGTPEERQRILSAIKEWAQNYPDQNASVYITAIDIVVTPGEIISHIEDETAIGVAILDVLVLEARRLGKLARSEIIEFLGRQFPMTNFRNTAED